jgi:peptidyl-prolyl cis-trans isomerase A (cyclophilin A)
MKSSRISLAVLAGALCGFLSLTAPPARAQDNGIFADFNTSLGSFTCRLDYTNAPKAVANFIGLATGARPWLDVNTGQIRTNPFHSGLTFHRVIATFMIQGGSPNGLGTDGPGYVFPDEFSPALRHDAPGVLSMANSGTNSNGAQFFVTVTNTPWLDNVHTVFGRVTAGMPVVYAISQVATDGNGKPLTNVTVASVAIRRIGTAAQAFDLQTQNLPVLSRIPLRIARGTTNVSLAFTNALYAENFLCASSNLTSWTTPASLGIDVASPLSNTVARALTAPAQFYMLNRVQYPSSTFAPRSVRSRTLTMAIRENGTLIINFDAAGGGNYSFNGSPGTVDGYTWIQEAYRGRLWPIFFSGLLPMRLRLDFASGNAGTLSGTVYPYYPFSDGAFAISGTFTLSAP